MKALLAGLFIMVPGFIHSSYQSAAMPLISPVSLPDNTVCWCGNPRDMGASTKFNQSPAERIFSCTMGTWPGIELRATARIARDASFLVHGEASYLGKKLCLHLARHVKNSSLI